MAGRGGLQKARYSRESLPALSIFPDGSVGHYARYRVVSEDRNRTSHWSPVYAVRVPPFGLMGEVQVTVGTSTVTAVWGDVLDRPRYDVFVRWGNTLSKIDTLNGVGTVHTHHDHGFVTGDSVEISGTGQSWLDGNTFTITQVTGQPKRFTIILPNGIGNDTIIFGSSAQAKTDYLYHGTPSVHNYSFLRLPLYDLVHVDVQVESIEKVYNTDLLVYDSPEPLGWPLP